LQQLLNTHIVNNNKTLFSLLDNDDNYKMKFKVKLDEHEPKYLIIKHDYVKNLHLICFAI
jgi:hypothetical protein